ncbi:hypothetical protein C8R46DRAFT_1109599 [Mycena filopes]|nr:hypothetical protein C8R46DRAFT_1109599 [Mycena filopes]
MLPKTLRVVCVLCPLSSSTMSVIPPVPAGQEARGGKTSKTDWLGAAITVAETVSEKSHSALIGVEPVPSRSMAQCLGLGSNAQFRILHAVSIHDVISIQRAHEEG